MDEYGSVLFFIIMVPICWLISLITNIDMLSLYLSLCLAGVLGAIVYEIVDIIKHGR